MSEYRPSPPDEAFLRLMREADAGIVDEMAETAEWVEHGDLHKQMRIATAWLLKYGGLRSVNPDHKLHFEDQVQRIALTFAATGEPEEVESIIERYEARVEI